jgi:hypothetical protein
MALFDNEAKILSFYSALLLLFLNVHNALGQSVKSQNEQDPVVFTYASIPGNEESIFDADHIATAILNRFRLCILFSPFNEDLGCWMKPHSTT